jgi:hypothetical protein
LTISGSAGDYTPTPDDLYDLVGASPQVLTHIVASAKAVELHLFLSGYDVKRTAQVLKMLNHT